jgi:hypothetical protein
VLFLAPPASVGSYTVGPANYRFADFAGMTVGV